ncbi:MAG: NAD(P)-dependent oxidoreductase [Polyangiaceae bacterium]|nr:NAD(P)-dependent oxidoreductase [Polyangiaceae bacterium]
MAGEAAGRLPDAILVTGATGFIGRRLVERLLDEGGASKGCFAATRPGGARALPPGAIAVPWDLHEELPAARMPARVDAVVHLAAPRDRYDERAEALPGLVRVAVDAAARLYAWARTAGVRHLVHVSTVSVLRPRVDVGEPLCDDSPRIEPPSHPYALAKLWAEGVAAAMRGHVEAVTIARPASVYGPGQGQRGGLATLARRIAAGEEIEIAGDGGHSLTPVFVDDVVEALLDALRAPRDATFSIGGPEALSERRIAEDLGAWLGRAPALRSSVAVPMMFGVSSARLDSMQPHRLRTPWEQGMRRTWTEGSARVPDSHQP